jgi:hypothetical protein
MGSGWQNILWPFQIGMMGAFATGLWAFNETDRNEIRRWRISILVAISLASAGGGIAVAAIIGLLLFLRKEWRALIALVPTLMLYGVWYLKYGVSQSQEGNLSKTPRYVLDSALAAGAGIGSKSLVFGGFVIGVLAVLYLQQQKSIKATSLVNVLVLFLLTTWCLTGLSRAHLGEPGASRYVYVGATCIVLLLGLLLPEIKTWPSIIGFLMAVILLVLPNMKMMRAGAQGLLDTSIHLRAEQSAVEHIRTSVRADYAIDGTRAPQLSAGEYLSAVDRFGSPAYSWKAVSSLPAETLVDVNKALIEGSSGVQPTLDGHCPSSQSQSTDLLSVKPQSSIQVLVKRPVHLLVNWFPAKLEAAYALEIQEPGIYVIRNSIEKESNELVISGDMQSLESCSQH